MFCKENATYISKVKMPFTNMQRNFIPKDKEKDKKIYWKNGQINMHVQTAASPFQIKMTLKNILIIFTKRHVTFVKLEFSGRI